MGNDLAQRRNAADGSAIAHGGQLAAAVQRFGRPRRHWLDLSTGINPDGWPVPPLPAELWRRLPEDHDGLEAAAVAYYGSRSLLPVAGSQAALQALPRLRERSRVAVLSPGYAEHAAAWQGCGHQVIGVDAAEIEQVLPRCETLVLINPNNPTGARFALDQLLDWHRRLRARRGWLVVDEAFMDVTAEHSLAPCCPLPGLIVLRSLGKFFGLAGLRVGFVLAEPELLRRMQTLLGPWALSTPARWIATRALSDEPWQRSTRDALAVSGRRLAGMLADHGLHPAGGCALFAWVPVVRAQELWDALAEQGILTRLFLEPPSLRFGLPAREPDWQRLEQALSVLARRGPDGNPAARPSGTPQPEANGAPPPLSTNRP